MVSLVSASSTSSTYNKNKFSGLNGLFDDLTGDGEYDLSFKVDDKRKLYNLKGAIKKLELKNHEEYLKFKNDPERVMEEERDEYRQFKPSLTNNAHILYRCARAYRSKIYNITTRMKSLMRDIKEIEYDKTELLKENHKLKKELNDMKRKEKERQGIIADEFNL